MGTIEKKYDYFKNEDFVINGKFARYVDKMWTQGKIGENSFFSRLIDLYAIAAVIGLKINSRQEDDLGTDDKRRVQLSTIANEYGRFQTIMQTILLLDDSRGMTPEEKARIAFDTNPKSEERYKADMELFNSYARGGIEYLYNQLVMRSTDPDDEFTDAKIANVINLLTSNLDDDIQ